MQEKLKKCRDHFEETRGIPHQLLSKLMNSNSNSSDSEEKEKESKCWKIWILQLIQLRNGKRYQMICCCYVYAGNTAIVTKNAFETLLSRVIDKAIKSILKLPLNRREFTWFKLYLFDSTIWYERVPIKKGKNVRKEKGSEVEAKINDSQQENKRIFCDCGEKLELTSAASFDVKLILMN